MKSKITTTLAMAFALLLALPCLSKAYVAGEKNDFIAGYDYTKSFLSPNKHRGKNFRKRLERVAEQYQSVCEKYMPDKVTECLIRILIEADGHDGSRTIDSYAREAGLTSIGYDQAVMLCDEYGVCGDPCFDAEFAIGAFSWLEYHERITLLEEAPYWSDWLPELCERNRAECEFIIALLFDVNAGKVEKVMKHVGAEKAQHPWWKTIKWIRKQTNEILNKMFEPLAVNLRRFGLRWGLVIQKSKIRKERNGGQHNWGPLKDQPKLKPPAKNPLPSEQQWRKECHLSKSKGWCLTHPTLSKKGKKKCVAKGAKK